MLARTQISDELVSAHVTKQFSNTYERSLYICVGVVVRITPVCVRSCHSPVRNHTHKRLYMRTRDPTLVMMVFAVVQAMVTMTLMMVVVVMVEYPIDSNVASEQL